MSRNNEVGSRFVDLMREQGAKDNGFDMTLATVTSINPIGISYNNVKPSPKDFRIVLSGCIQTAEALEDAIDSEPEVSQGFKDALKELISGIKLSVGDSVVVQRVGDIFYVIGKVNP